MSSESIDPIKPASSNEAQPVDSVQPETSHTPPSPSISQIEMRTDEVRKSWQKDIQSFNNNSLLSPSLKEKITIAKDWLNLISRNPEIYKKWVKIKEKIIKKEIDDMQYQKQLEKHWENLEIEFKKWVNDSQLKNKPE